MDSVLTGMLSMCSGGKIFGKSFLFLVEWNKEYFVLEIFKESLLALNQFATFLSSSFIVSKRFPILELEINKFVSSAGLSMSILHMGDKSAMQRGFFTNSMGDGPMVSGWAV